MRLRQPCILAHAHESILGRKTCPVEGRAIARERRRLRGRLLLSKGSGFTICLTPNTCLSGLRSQSVELKSLKGTHVDITHSPNALREILVDFFRNHSAVWDVRVQLCRDLTKMPIENAATVWPEAISPFITVAQLTVPAQPAWSDARSMAVDDGTSFSPWHGITSHRPLGSIMRVRKAAYEASAQFRANHNGQPIVEPLSSDAIA